jgi:hypothetical protein
MPHLSLFLIFGLIHMVVNGCAVGNIGTMAAKVEHFEGVRVVEVYSVGLHIRTRMDDTGAHLGYSQRKYIFSDRARGQSSWHFFRVPLPSDEAVAQDFKTVGVDVTTNEPESGIAIGYQHTTLHARAPVGTSVYLEYKGNPPRLVNIRNCEEGKLCDTSTSSLSSVWW